MSGKTVYIKTIAILQIMAQVIAHFILANLKKSRYLNIDGSIGMKICGLKCYFFKKKSSLVVIFPQEVPNSVSQIEYSAEWVLTILLRKIYPLL